MRRILAIAGVLLAAGVIVVLGSGAGNGGSYQVRAIFRNAFSLVPGEDVKEAGVKVGKIKSLDVTPDQQAAVVLDIQKAGFQDFRTDATCTIRPQSLIGEKFVECTPTQPHPVGTPLAPPLRKITSGPGKGQHLLPVSQTMRPVDLDLVNNIVRLPYRERLSVIINELGTGLAGRGIDLRAAIRQADPALRETDRVLKLLGDQNRVLRDLARDSDTVLAPLGRQRRHVADFVAKAATVSQATAERRAALEANLRRLPAFLRQLKPTMTRLGALSDEMTPVLSDLGAQAPAIARLILELGPFSRAATPALKSLGSAADVGRVALVKAKPIISDLKDFATAAHPLTDHLAELTTSFHDTGGIERLLDYAFYQTTAINGFDAVGHYLRASLIVNLCSTYQTTADPACSANFTSTKTSAGARAAANAGRSPALVREDAVLRGASPQDVLGHRHRRHGARHRQRSGPAPLQLPVAVLPGQGAPARPTGPVGSAPVSHPAAPSENAVQSLLDYLLGGGP